MSNIPEDILNNAYWIDNDIREPKDGNYHFVFVEDNGGFIMDILEATHKRYLTENQTCWEQLDGRKYTEEAKVKYWLQSHR